MPKKNQQPRSTAEFGVWVQYCGHNAMFKADLFRVRGAVCVRANGPIRDGSAGNLFRPAKGCKYHLEDFPDAGFWRQDLGVFVVPEEQVTKL